MKKCLVCWDSQNETSIDPLINCGDTFCAKCLEQWVYLCENQGQDEVTCPACETHMNEDEVVKLIGRKYVPKVWLGAGEVTEEPDSDLKAWLEDNEAQQCARCSTWMVREEGCDAMQCLCGFRFCWQCRAAADDRKNCECEHEDFFDNVLGMDVNMERPVATKEDFGNFAQFLDRCAEEDESDEDEDEDAAADNEDRAVEAETKHKSSKSQSTTSWVRFLISWSLRRC